MLIGADMRGVPDGPSPLRRRASSLNDWSFLPTYLPQKRPPPGRRTLLRGLHDGDCPNRRRLPRPKARDRTYTSLRPAAGRDHWVRRRRPRHSFRGSIARAGARRRPARNDRRCKACRRSRYRRRRSPGLLRIRTSRPSGAPPATALEKGPQPVPNEFTVAIHPDVPVRMYQARFTGRFGVSNPRTLRRGQPARADPSRRTITRPTRPPRFPSTRSLTARLTSRPMTSSRSR